MVRLTDSKLAKIARQEVGKYAGGSPHARVFPVLDDEHKTYAITGIENEPGDDTSWLMLQAHVEANKIVIDADFVFDKKLVYALESAGVPREQIVLAYEGERVNDVAEQST
jgi:hypothetical protein